MSMQLRDLNLQKAELYCVLHSYVGQGWAYQVWAVIEKNNPAYLIVSSGKLYVGLSFSPYTGPRGYRNHYFL